MKTILITGCAGFIGSHVSEYLLKRGDTVIGIDEINDYYNIQQKLDNLKILNKYENFKFYKEDIANKENIKKIFQENKITHIGHLGARAGVRPSIENPFIYEHSNILGTLTLLDLAKDFNIQNFVLTSSSSVYGNSKDIPFKETQNVDLAISPYAATKKATEVLAYTYHHLHKINVNIVRPFTIYGPRGRPDMAPYLFISKVVNQKAINKFGDGTSKRDYTYIDDFVKGFVSAIDTPLGYEIFNLGNKNPVSLNEFIETIEKITGKKAIINQMGKQAGDVDITYARGSGLWTYNRTNLSNGVYTYYFSANDTSNNIWTSQNSTFTVRSLDSNETTINQSNFTAPANATNLIVDELHNVTIPKESESTVTLDLSNQIADGKITLSNPVILKRETNTENYTIEIPLGTKLSSNDSWDGKLIIPEIRTNMQVPQDTQGTVDLALKMGSDDYEISFDKAVKIILPGNAGKSAGWTRGNNTLIPITTTCDSTTNPTNIDPVNTRICKVDDGNDLLIFTYHFTTFAAYTQTSPSGGGGSSKTSSITKSYTIGEIEKNEIINKELEENQQIKFNLDSEQHSLELNRIDYTNKQITIIIRSEPITLKLNEYEFKTVDVDKDGKDDLKVWFEFESSRKANIFVERIEESNTFKQEEVESKQNDDTNNVEIIKQENNNLQIEDKTSNDNQIEKVDNSKINEKTEEQSGNSQLLIGLFVILLLFIIISIVIFNYSKKEEMLKKNKIKKN